MMRVEAPQGMVLVAVVIVVVVVVVVVMLLRRETRGYDTARSERVVGWRMVVGTGSLSGSSGDSSSQATPGWQTQALSRRSGRLVRCLAQGRSLVLPCDGRPLGLGSRG